MFNFNFEIEFFLSFRDLDEFEHFGTHLCKRDNLLLFRGESQIMTMKHNVNVLCKQQPQRVQILMLRLLLT